VKLRYTVAVIIVMIMIGIPISKAAPTGPDTVSALNSSRINASSAATVQALAGNVTELNINANTVTRFWQGYYGNISGTIVLGNAEGVNLYQWAAANPQGEIYATKNSTAINWTNVGCANESQILNEDSWIGATINNSDSANHTFAKTNHPSFYTGNKLVSECRSTSVNGTGDSSIFWEALLVDNGTNAVSMADDIFIYTAILDQNRLGFDARTHDFQMIVGEPGAGSEEWPNGNPTTYYFYVELE
jgi:hypothetical protein